jgi:hypothetical protein
MSEVKTKRSLEQMSRFSVQNFWLCQDYSLLLSLLKFFFKRIIPSTRLNGYSINTHKLAESENSVAASTILWRMIWGRENCVKRISPSQTFDLLGSMNNFRYVYYEPVVRFNLESASANMAEHFDYFILKIPCIVKRCCYINCDEWYDSSIMHHYGGYAEKAKYMFMYRYHNAE